MRRETNVLVLLHLLEEVTLGAVEPLHKPHNVVKVGDNVVRVAHDRLSARDLHLLLERWHEHDVLWLHLATLSRHLLGRWLARELQLDVEQRRLLSLGELDRVNVREEEFERRDHRASDAGDEDIIDELDVRTPCRRALGDLEHLVGRRKQVVDLFAAVGDLFLPRLQLLRVVSHERVDLVRLGRWAHEQRVGGPLLQHDLDGVHVTLHLGEVRVRLRDKSHRLLDERRLVRLRRVPSEALQPTRKHFVNLLHLCLEQRLFDGQHRAQHVIILLLDRCELLALHAQRLGLFIEVHGNLRDVFGLHDKVFHLIQQLDQLQVKVDGQLRALDIRGEQRKR
mmetsp:Transcript_44778/g.132234  ORF Transcript_44778/g.132234 Transcript_44778/m.132234 type:complete len:338 (+) Transcript_44778:2789-3802(+)